jgi:hypothetical protein
LSERFTLFENGCRTPQGEVPRMHLLGTGVKIDLATVIFMASGWPVPGHGTLG